MAYNFLDEKNLKDVLNDSEAYMRPLFEQRQELERLTRGKPGKVAPGKPRVTDGTLAGIRRETPKQVIQQIPTGRPILKTDIITEEYVNAVLTDVLIPNANSGGTPYSKSKRAIKSTIDVGSAWAYCFFNRRGNLLHADYRLIYFRDLLFETGKVSEFDSNFLPFVMWMTKSDIQSIIYQEKQRKVTETEWDLQALQELLDTGESEKDTLHKAPAELKNANDTKGYFKLVKFLQVGVNATFYTYAPKIDKVVHRCTNKDPRGIMPIHGLVPEEDDGNPLGEPLAAISAGKQNLLDFDMQNYQYHQGMGTDPAIKKWGQTPDSKIQIAPGKIIGMMGTKQTDDFEVVNISNEAIANYANNYGLIKSQILNETGRTGDTSISTQSGNPGFGKTPAAVKQNAGRLSISDNDLRMTYEQWQGRIYETLLNIHFAESKGSKEIELDPMTLKRLKLDKNPVIDYEKEYGPIKYTVTASTSQKLSDAEQVQNMQALAPVFTMANIYYLKQAGWNFDIGEYYHGMLQRANIDGIDRIMTKMDDTEAAQAKQEPFPIIDAPQLRMNSADLSPEQIAAILQQQAGISVPLNPAQPGGPPAGLSAQGQADFIVESQKAQAEVLKAQAEIHAKLGQQQQDAAAPTGPSPDELAMKQHDMAIKQQQVDNEAAKTALAFHKQHAENVLRADKQAHDTTLAVDNHIHQQMQPQEPVGATNGK